VYNGSWGFIIGVQASGFEREMGCHRVLSPDFPVSRQRAKGDLTASSV